VKYFIGDHNGNISREETIILPHINTKAIKLKNRDKVIMF